MEVDDQAHALIRFASGATGSLSASWVAVGRTMQLAFEITGTKGSIAFTQERLNELELYVGGQPHGRKGFKTITAGPEHPPYGAFTPAPGHQLGFNDLKDDRGARPAGGPGRRRRTLARFPRRLGGPADGRRRRPLLARAALGAGRRNLTGNGRSRGNPGGHDEG